MLIRDGKCQQLSPCCVLLALKCLIQQVGGQVPNLYIADQTFPDHRPEYNIFWQSLLLLQGGFSKLIASSLVQSAALKWQGVRKGENSQSYIGLQRRSQHWVLFGANVVVNICTWDYAEQLCRWWRHRSLVLGAGLSLLVPGRKWHHSLPLTPGNLCRNEYGSKLLLSWTSWPSVRRKAVVGSWQKGVCFCSLTLLCLWGSTDGQCLLLSGCFQGPKGAVRGALLGVLL